MNLKSSCLIILNYILLVVHTLEGKKRGIKFLIIIIIDKISMELFLITKKI
jgi:hypothetical protein